MENPGLDVVDGSPFSDQRQAYPEETKKLEIQKCIQALAHAYQCRSVNFCSPGCQKMKRALLHTKICKRKASGGCQICKQIVAICCYHSKQCQETKCPISFCLNVKQKLRQHQLQKRLQEAQLMRRRMAARNKPTATMGALPGSSVTGGAVSPAGIITIPPTSNMIGIQSTRTPGVGLKPRTETSPANVQQVVRHVQEGVTGQQFPYLQVPCGKVTPPAAAGGPSQVMPPLQIALGPVHSIPEVEWMRYASNSSLQQNHVLELPNPQRMLQQPSIAQATSQPQQGVGMGSTHIPGPGPNPGPQQPGTSDSVVVNGVTLPGLAVRKYAMRQLLVTLYSPYTLERAMYVLQLLKEYPWLKPAFDILKQGARQSPAGGAGQGPGGVIVPNQSLGIVSQQQQQQQQL